MRTNVRFVVKHDVFILGRKTVRDFFGIFKLGATQHGIYIGDGEKGSTIYKYWCLVTLGRCGVFLVVCDDFQWVHRCFFSRTVVFASFLRPKSLAKRFDFKAFSWQLSQIGPFLSENHRTLSFVQKWYFSTFLALSNSAGLIAGTEKKRPRKSHAPAGTREGLKLTPLRCLP